MGNTRMPTVPESKEEPTMNGMSWIGAGMLAGMILAVSTSPPALAVTSPALQDGPWKGPGGFTIKGARHLEYCKNNKKFHKRYKDQIYKKKNKGRKNMQMVQQFGIGTYRRLQASKGARLCMVNASVEKQTDCHASSQQVRVALRVASLLQLSCFCTLQVGLVGLVDPTSPEPKMLTKRF